MTTVTHLALTVREAQLLITNLRVAVADAKKSHEIRHVEGDYDQASDTGPWRLRLTVVPTSDDLGIE